MPTLRITKTQLIFSVLALVLVGVACILLRLTLVEATLPDEREDHWRIDYLVKLRPNGTTAQGRIALPKANSRIKILAESFSHSQLEVSFNQNQQSLEREVLILAPPHAKSVYFEAQLDILVDKQPESSGPFLKDLTPEAAESYLRLNDGIAQMSQSVVADAQSGIIPQVYGPEKALKAILHYCADIKNFPSKKDTQGTTLFSDSGQAIEPMQGTASGKASTMVTLCRAAGIPARLVSGFVLTDIPLEQTHCWVEAYLEGVWRIYDPVMEKSEPDKAHYLPVRRDNTSPIELSGGQDHYIQCSAKRKVPLTNGAASGDRKFLTILDFTNLPPNLSDAAALVLLLPLGGLVISIFSNIFGLKSFGYFIPALIGISFVDAPWKAGIIVFIVIISIGLGGRELLDRLNLNKMPRLSLILVFVVLSLTFTVSLLDLLNIRPNPRTILFPMISLTVMIEHFHTKIEEAGYREAFIKLCVTLSVALSCCLLFRLDILQWLFLSFPEAQLFVAAALVFVGSFKKNQIDTVSSLNTPKPETGNRVNL